MKKQIPILMSTMMVQAELAGRKTMTRRTSGLDEINESPDKWEFDRFETNVKGGINAVFKAKEEFRTELGLKFSIPCPYGQPGDILYVREDHYRYGKWEKNGVTKKGNQKWKFVATRDEVLYADAPPATNWKSRQAGEEWVKQGWKESWYKRLARFMPKKYARIWLEVTGLRVERLQDISEQDAKAEGADGILCQYVGDEHDQGYTSWVEGFKVIWKEINGEDAWIANPWVWVVSFRVLSTTGKPAGLEKEVAG